jgi:hypothetical protein
MWWLEYGSFYALFFISGIPNLSALSALVHHSCIVDLMGGYLYPALLPFCPPALLLSCSLALLLPYFLTFSLSNNFLSYSKSVLFSVTPVKRKALELGLVPRGSAIFLSQTRGCNAVQWFAMNSKLNLSFSL